MTAQLYIGPYMLDSYSALLFQPWANPKLYKVEMSKFMN